MRENVGMKSWFGLVGTLFVSAAIAVMVGCVAPATAPPPTQPASPVPTLVAPTAVPTQVLSAASPVPTITHLPRQHSADHVPGLADPVDARNFVDSYPNHAQTLSQSPVR